MNGDKGAGHSTNEIVPVAKTPNLPTPTNETRALTISLMGRILALPTTPRASMTMLLGACGGTIVGVTVGLILGLLFGFGFIFATFSAVVILPCTVMGAVLGLLGGERNATLPRRAEIEVARAARRMREIVAAAANLPNEAERARETAKAFQVYKNEINAIFEKISKE
ncbi:hypothetical protein ACNOYE_10345 [Nannocystaceae bacterium ST9]